MEKKIDVTLTLREQDRLRTIKTCCERIEKKIARDPNSTRVKGWEARLEEYERGVERLYLMSKLKALAPGLLRTAHLKDIDLTPGLKDADLTLPTKH